MTIKLKWDRTHSKNLPTIRIAEIELNNFKSVHHGKVVFNCGRRFVPYGTQSDILGVYGQNGSGKTALIEAISIFKYMISGEQIPMVYADCIDKGAEYATLSFTLEFQYPEGNEYESNNDIRKFVYSFDLKRVPSKDVDLPKVFVDDDFNQLWLPAFDEKVEVLNETIKISGTFQGKKAPLKPYLEVREGILPIGPETKAKTLIGKITDEKRIELAVNLKLAKERAMSFVFMPETMKVFSDNSNYSTMYQMLLELRTWGKNYLFVIDTKTEALVRANTAIIIPNSLDKDGIPFFLPLQHPFQISNENYDELAQNIDTLSGVLTQLVPGLRVYLKDLGGITSDDGSNDRRVEFVAQRDDVEIPLRCESDGVIKLIVTLGYLITVFNQKSTTVAFDEFDSGIFEYLLGEILVLLQDSGKGQFIFTSHNLRPLEVLRKEFICFTTTDPNNRYMKMTGIGETNNLRRVYYREITMNDHYDNLYNETKRSEIISAMRKAGGSDGKT